MDQIREINHNVPPPAESQILRAFQGRIVRESWLAHDPRLPDLIAYESEIRLRIKRFQLRFFRLYVSVEISRAFRFGETILLPAVILVAPAGILLRLKRLALQQLPILTRLVLQTAFLQARKPSKVQRKMRFGQVNELIIAFATTGKGTES